MIKNKSLILLLTPFLIFFTMTFLLGLISMIKDSFGLSPFSESGFTFKYYIEVLTSEKFYSSLLYSIYLGIIPTLISLIFGTTLAIMFFLAFDKSNKIFNVASFPNVIPYTIYTFVVIILIMQSGFFSRVLYALNIIDAVNDFPLLMYDKYGIAILIIYTFKQVPFVFYLVYSSLNKIGRKHINVSYSLGAGKIYTAFKVVIPSIKSTLISVFFLCFSFNFGSFEVPFIVGSPRYETLAIMSHRKYTSPVYGDRHYALAINVLLLVVCCAMLAKYVKKSNSVVSFDE